MTETTVPANNTNNKTNERKNNDRTRNEHIMNWKKTTVPKQINEVERISRGHKHDERQGKVYDVSPVDAAWNRLENNSAPGGHGCDSIKSDSEFWSSFTKRL